MTSKIVLYPHQKKVSQHLKTKRGCLSFFSTGTGKSLTSAAAAHTLLKNKLVDRVIVFVRKSAISQITNEFQKYFTQMKNASWMSKVVVTTHQTFFRHNHQKGKYFLIVDEAHQFVNLHSKESQQVFTFAYNAEKVLLLTATPFVNGVYDIVPLVTMVKHHVKKLNINFEESHSLIYKNHFKSLILSEKEFSELIRHKKKYIDWIDNSIHVYTIDKNHNSNYPRLTNHDVSIQMSGKSKARYLKQEKDPGPFYQNLRSLNSHDNLKEFCEKCEWITKRVKEWIKKGEGKIVIYSSFVEHGARLIGDLLTKEGVNVITIDGQSSEKYRRQTVELFNRGLTPQLSSTNVKKPKKEEKSEKKIDMKNLVKDVKNEYIKSSAIKNDEFKHCGQGNTWFVVENKFKKDSNNRYVNNYVFFKNGRRFNLSKKEEDYFKSMVVPPMWTPAKICKPNDKIVWVAKDSKNRWHYKYSNDWTEQQELLKIIDLKHMTSTFWKKFDKTICQDLKKSELKNLAIASLLLQHCHFRPAHQRPTHKRTTSQKSEPNDDDFHYGLTTLLNKHITVSKDSINIEFLGKSAKINKCIIKRPVKQNRSKPNQSNETILYHSLLSIYEKKHPYQHLLQGVSAGRLSDYLHQFEVKPKYFRTYFANYKLMEELLNLYIDQRSNVTTTQGKDKSDFIGSLTSRKRFLNQVYQKVSAGLDNTPTITKKSYVFTGFHVLYLYRPDKLKEIFDKRFNDKNSQNQNNVSDILIYIIELFDRNELNWKAMLDERGILGSSLESFKGDLNVLMISDSGAESIDLKGVRHIVFVDPVWNPSMEQQIIGRGQRYKSHHHLPESKRSLSVWKLYLDKNTSSRLKMEKGECDLEKCSVDRLIHQLSMNKEKDYQKLINWISKTEYKNK